jgi:hypothetical protein
VKVSRKSAFSAIPGSYLTGISAKRDCTACPMARLSAFGEEPRLLGFRINKSPMHGLSKAGCHRLMSSSID